MILVQSSSNVEDAWSVDASAGGWDVVNNAIFKHRILGKNASKFIGSVSLSTKTL